MVFRHVPFEDLGIARELLETRGYEIEYVDAGVDPIRVGSVLDADLLVVAGGPIGAYETERYPFLLEESEAITARAVRGLPTVGICLGAQLLALALGARVRATGRKEIGYAPLTLTNAGKRSVLAPLENVPVLHWHGDEFTIPDGAQRLAETPGFPHQAFAMGRALIGLQFHLEADHTQIERWLIGHAHELSTAGIDTQRIRDDARRWGPVLRESAELALGSWLDQLHAHDRPSPPSTSQIGHRR